MRYLLDGPQHIHGSLPKTPFSVSNAPSVFLETIKRSDNENFIDKQQGSNVVILRLYEALGGHATAQLNISGNLQVSRATLTNLLEDHLETLEVVKATDDSSTSVSLSFHGFQVVTVKLVVTVASSFKPHTDGG